MKILFWTEVFWPHIGGAEIFCLNLYKSLRDRGHELILITDLNRPNLAERAEVEGLPVYRLPFREGLTGKVDQLAYAKKRVAALKEEFHPDLIHLHTYGPASIFHVESQQRRRIPTLMTLHVHPNFSLKPGSDFLNYLTRSIDGFSAVSSSVFAEGAEYFPDPSLKKYCIVNAIPEPTKVPEPATSHEPACLLSLGRMVSEKGFKTALQAFSRLAETFPDLKYVIAGDGPDLAALKGEANRLGIASRVDFRGWVAPQDIPALMAESAMVLVPSEWEEPFGLVALEAAHLGKAVVATRSGGLPEIVMEGETGRLVEKGKADEMAQAVADLLHDPEMTQAMGRRARKRAREVFPYEPMVDRYERAYAEILAAAPRKSL